MLVSVTLGLLIVFSFESSTTVGTTKKTLSPVADLVLGGLALVVAFVVGTGRDKAITQRRAEKPRTGTRRGGSARSPRARPE
jgi:hypothetical protein